MSKKIFKLTILVIILVMITPVSVSGQDSSPVHATILHTNDFHGRLETDYRGRGGSAYMASVINYFRTTAGEENVLLLDAGDEFFAAPAISQLLLGESTVDIYNMLGYDLAVLGNHEFDKGADVLIDRVAQSDYPWLGANVVVEEGTEWEHPEWVVPYTTLTVGSPPNQAVLGVIGVDTDETPQVTILGATEGLEFKDLTESILHYYDEVMAQSDALIVVAHMGTNDSGDFKGLQTVAQELIDAGKPVDLMIGGHQHQALYEPVWVSDTAIVSAGYYGRWLGHLEVSIDTAAKRLYVDEYELITITATATRIQNLIGDTNDLYIDGEIDNHGILNSLLVKLEGALATYERGQTKSAINKLEAFIKEVEAQSDEHITPEVAEALMMDAMWTITTFPDPEVAARVTSWAEIVAPIVNQMVGVTNIDLVRDYNAESNMGDIVTDSMRWSADLYDDGALNGSVDIAFTNPGGLRADIRIPEGASLPYTVTWGMTFDVLPFGNTLYLMDLTGAQIQTLLDQSANLYKGILQTSGASWNWCNNTGDDTATEWGAYDVKIGGTPIVPGDVYRVVTNNFLAGGQDGWTTFADGTNRWDTYYDMQEGFVEYINADRVDGLGVIDTEDIPMDRIIYLDACP
jgi:2',3'-cyclic-nucleotide 2'-phosphodiesterase (5'-nucleotidase family)